MGRSAVLMLNKADIGGSGSPFSYEFEKLVMSEADIKYRNMVVDKTEQPISVKG